MKKLVYIVVVILICIFNFSCIERASGRDSNKRLLYPKEDVVHVEIVIVGAMRLEKEDLPELTSIVVIEDIESAINDFLVIPAENYFGDPGRVRENDIAIKVEYSNSHIQLFTCDAIGETRDPNEHYSTRWYNCSAASFTFDRKEFWAFVTKCVEQYGGDMQVVLENEDYKQFH